MKKGAHLFIGIIAFLAYAYLFSFIVRIPTDGLILGFFGVLIGSVIPDYLEPPTNWMHRGIGHSIRALKFVTTIFAITTVCGIISFLVSTFSMFFLIACFFLGYLMHLLADATTEVGLPD